MSVLTRKEFTKEVWKSDPATVDIRALCNTDAALRAIIRRAVEDVEKMGHAKGCEFGKMVVQIPPFETFTKPTCRSMSSCHSCERCKWLDSHPPQANGQCNCGHDAAIERMKKGLGRNES